jgi:hypothetical protein
MGVDAIPFSSATDPIGLVNQFVGKYCNTLSSVKKLCRQGLKERGICTLLERVHNAINSVLLVLKALSDTTSRAKDVAKVSKSMAKSTLKSRVRAIKGLLNALPGLRYLWQ